MRLLKYVAYLFMLCVALIIAGAVFISNYINPNDYKPQLSEYVQEKTGRSLTFNGDLRWSFFPRLGVSVKDVQLGNSPGFGMEPFAKIHEASIAIQVIPLLQKEFKINSIKLNGLELRLIKNAEGKTNWQDLKKQETTNTRTVTTITTGETKNIDKSAFIFAIAELEISNGRLIWENQQKKQLITVHDIELHTKNIHENNTFPVSLSFAVDTNKIKTTFSSTFNVHTTPKNLHLNDIKAQFDKTHITGKIAVNDFEKKELTFDATLDQIHINNYVESKEKPAKLFLANVKASGTAKLNHDSSENIHTQGQIHIGTLQAGEIHATAVNSHFNINNGVIKLDPVSAQLYQGKSTGSINLDMRTPETHLSSRQTLSGIQIEPLLNDLKALTKIKVSGAANLETYLSSSGKDTAALTRNLNGQINFSINNGVLYGIDLDLAVGTFISTMDSLIRNIKSSPAEIVGAVTGKLNPVLQNRAGQTTRFTTFTGNLNLANGSVSNNDLLMHTASMRITGAGSANLINQTIDYRLRALKNDPKTNQPYDYELPLLITGSMDHPNIRLDASYVNQVIQKEIGRVAKNKLADVITKNIGGEAGKKLGEQLKNLDLNKFFK